jgi:1-phosphofructokinase
MPSHGASASIGPAMDAAHTAHGAPRIAVFAPSALVTVTIEHGGEQSEVHFHAGGQGVWVAHMAGALGARAVLSTVLGGESGRLLSVLLEAHGVTVHAATAAAANGVYVHDRRGGTRTVLAEVPAPRLQRHEFDELYGAAIADALDCGLACLTGPQHAGVLEAADYTRLAADLRRNGVTVLADLTGPALTAVLRGGVDLLKLSESELVSEGWASEMDTDGLVEGLRGLHAAGARNVLATRGPQPALALVEGRLFELRGPRFTAADPTGTGDAMFAGIAVGLARGDGLEDAIAFGAAAGAINATRHGLGTGNRRQVEELARHVVLIPLDAREAGAA